MTKQWSDDNNQDGKRPSSIKVQLYANDEMYGDAVNVTQNSKWTYTWRNLPAKKNGKTIAYNVKEDVPEGYTATYDTSNQGNMIVINSHMPISRVQTKVKTGDSTNYMKYVLAAGISGLVIFIWLFMKRKKTI